VLALRQGVAARHAEIGRGPQVLSIHEDARPARIDTGFQLALSRLPRQGGGRQWQDAQTAQSSGGCIPTRS
jgi:hypothetical protein